MVPREIICEFYLRLKLLLPKTTAVSFLFLLVFSSLCGFVEKHGEYDTNNCVTS